MKNNKLKIHFFMYLLLNIMFLTLFIDYTTFLFKFDYIYNFFIGLIFLILINFLIKDKLKIIFKFDKADVIFLFVLLAIFAITVPYPDRSYDTINYHLYLQENPFGDKINFDFFAGKNLNSFSYAFPDRMFYLFRYFLGYRLGTILNYLIITVMFFQVKYILKKLISQINTIPLVITSTLIVTTLSIIDIVDSYYVDLISLVLLLEIFRIVIFKKLNNKDNNTSLFMYFGFLFGFAFCVKISNAVLLILLFLIYIFKNNKMYKCLTIKNVLLTLIAFLLPFILYLIYTYIQTGNPVFPFYNTIFKSDYFQNRNWLDTRFGPSRKLEILFWPIIILFQPFRSCDISIMEPIWCIGYIISIFYVMYYSYRKLIKKKEVNKSKLLFFVSTILFYLFWAGFQLGYSRYGLVVLVLGSISTYVFLYDIVRNKKNILIGTMSILMLYNFSYIVGEYMYKESFWIYNNYYNNKKNYDYNLNNIFSDGNENKIMFTENSVWAIFYDNAGFAQIINNDIAIINVINAADNNYTKKLVDKKLSKASSIYTLTDSLDFDNFIKKINKTKYKIVDVNEVLSSSLLGRKTDYIYIFKIEKMKTNNNNNYEIFNSIKEFDVTNQSNISLFLGLAKDSNQTYQFPLEVSIVGKNGNEETIIDKIQLSPDGMMEQLEYDVENYEYLKIVTLDQHNLVIDGNWMMYVNYNEK